MTIEKKLLATNPVSGDVPEAVSFDGTNDYLSRSSDMTNNADGKTFTFSCWVYIPSGYAGTIGVYNVGSFWIQPDKDGGLGIVGYGPSGGNPAFYSNLPANSIPLDTYSNILVSINVNGGVSTRLRHVYINDVNVTPANADWYESEGSGWYNDKLINFTPDNGTIRVGANAASQKLKGRLAHVFLDYTYRDLSVTSNRRLFIDADGKPSSTIPSSPILYLPMTDAATAGSNSGTGGDFTVNGVLATAERGPNQDNCSASKFDGSNDYLSKTSGIGGSAVKVFTASVNIDRLSNKTVFDVRSEADGTLVQMYLDSSRINLYSTRGTSGTAVFHARLPLSAAPVGSHAHLDISVDLSDTSKRLWFVNGVDKSSSVTWVSYLNENFNPCGRANIASYTSNNNFYNGSIGEFYFNSVYTDLATSNPFWDSDANRPNSVRKVIADTSVTPLIALPIIGNDAGNNLGSGGDFTVNSGPFTGARGGSEFWTRSAETTGTNGDYLGRTGLTGGASSANITVAFAVYLDTNNAQKQWWHMVDNELLAMNDSNGTVFIGNAYASSDVTISTSGTPFSTGSWHTVLFSMVSNGTSAQRHVYVDGVIPASTTWTQTRSAFDLSLSRTCAIQSDSGGTQVIDGKVAGLYIEQVYTDFSQEVNRNKFIDQLGYMVEQIDGSPLVYMKFENTAALGTNSGSGGNFTVNGTVTAGADFTP